MLWVHERRVDLLRRRNYVKVVRWSRDMYVIALRLRRLTASETAGGDALRQTRLYRLVNSRRKNLSPDVLDAQSHHAFHDEGNLSYWLYGGDWALRAVHTLLWTLRASCTRKLSYRKQIARQLCTQYVEGICSNSVTLKYGLEVTKGHCQSASNLRHRDCFEATVLKWDWRSHHNMHTKFISEILALTTTPSSTTNHSTKTKKLISRRDRRTLPLEPNHRRIIVLIIYTSSHVPAWDRRPVTAMRFRGHDFDLVNSDLPYLVREHGTIYRKHKKNNLHWPQTKPTALGRELACRLLESIPTVTIYYYSNRKPIFILPPHGE